MLWQHFLHRFAFERRLTPLELLYLLFIGFAVSIDGFFAGAAYGVKRIHVPRLSLFAIGAVTLLCTQLAHNLSDLLADSLQSLYVTLAGALLLVCIGAANLLQQFVSKRRAKNASDEATKPLTFSCGKIVISVMFKPEAADLDRSNRLSLCEALLLGAALGIDNMAATFAAGLTHPLPAYTPLAMCCIQTLLVSGGIWFARSIASARVQQRFAYAPGLILILLGLSRLF